MARNIQYHEKQGPRDKIARLLNAAMISFIIEGNLKIFPDKKKLKEFVITRLSFYKMLKGII